MRSLELAGQALRAGLMAILGAICAGCASMPPRFDMDSHQSSPAWASRPAPRTLSQPQPPLSTGPTGGKPTPAASQEQQDRAPEVKPGLPSRKPLDADRDSYERHPAKWREKLRAKYA